MSTEFWKHCVETGGNIITKLVSKQVSFVFIRTYRRPFVLRLRGNQIKVSYQLR